MLRFEKQSHSGSDSLRWVGSRARPGQRLAGSGQPDLNPVIPTGPLPSLGPQFPHPSLPPSSVVRSDVGCEGAWSRLIDGLMSLVGVLGKMREIIQGAVSRLESAERSLLPGGGRLHWSGGAELVPRRRWLRGNGCAPFLPWQQPGAGRPPGHGAPRRAASLRSRGWVKWLGCKARAGVLEPFVQDPEKERNVGPGWRGGREGRGNLAPRGRRMIHQGVAG